MLKVSPVIYMALGSLFESWRPLNILGNQVVPVEVLDKYRSALLAMKHYCETTDLHVSVKIIANYLESLGMSVSRAEISGKMGQIRECIEAETDSRLFYYIPAERAEYVAPSFEHTIAGNVSAHRGAELARFEPALKKFPSSAFDIEEAGNCFAAGRFTACVYHLARAVERGLVALADHAGVDKEAQANWNKALNQANSFLRNRENGFKSIKPNSPKEQYYSEAIGLLRNFKTAWRNPASHSSAMFGKDEARDLFQLLGLLWFICRRISAKSRLPRTQRSELILSTSAQ